MRGGQDDGHDDTRALIVDAAAYAQAVEDAVKARPPITRAAPPLDDDAYDRLVRGIQATRPSTPTQVLPDSPTGKVAGGAVVGDVPHTVPMLSLDNVFSRRGAGRSGRPGWSGGSAARSRPTAWSPSSTAWRSRPVTRGRLTQLVTRGDGAAGEDVSHAIGTIVGLPPELAEPVTVEMRGEVLMTNEQFEDACAKRAARTTARPFANPRSASAGTLRAKDRPYVCELTFFGYGALPLPRRRLRARRAAARAAAQRGHGAGRRARRDDHGRHRPSPASSPTTLERVQERIGEIAAAAAGAAVRHRRHRHQGRLAADQAAGRVRLARAALGDRLQAARHREDHPAAGGGVERRPHRHHRPARRAGAGRDRRQHRHLRHAAQPRRHRPARACKLGDRVMVLQGRRRDPPGRGARGASAHRRGAADPHPRGLPALRDADRHQSQERWRCVQGRDCQAVASIVYAAGRDQLDIEGLAETRIVQMVDAGLIVDFADLFTLTREQMLGLERMGETSTDNLLAAIEQAKAQPLSRVFCALGRARHRAVDVPPDRPALRHHGRHPRRRRRGDPGGRRHGQGEGAVDAWPSWRSCPAHRQAGAAGVNMTEPGVTPPAPGDVAAAAGAATARRPRRPVARERPPWGTRPELPLAGKTVVVTGSMTGALEELSRNQMNELIETGRRQVLLQRLRQDGPAGGGREGRIQARQGRVPGRGDHHP